MSSAAGPSAGQLSGAPFFTRLLSASTWFTNTGMASTSTTHTKHRFRSTQAAPMKPPNILIYSGPPTSARTSPSAAAAVLNTLNMIGQSIQTNIVDNIRSLVSACMNKDAYVVYELTDSQALSSPWADNTALLINCCENLSSHIRDQFVKYFHGGGKLLSFGCVGLDSQFVNVETSLDVAEQFEISLNLQPSISSVASYSMYPSTTPQSQYICRYISYQPSSPATPLQDSNKIVATVPFISKSYFYRDSIVMKHITTNENTPSTMKCFMAECANLDVMVKITNGCDGVAILTPLIAGYDWPILETNNDGLKSEFEQSKTAHEKIMQDLLSKHLLINCDQQAKMMLAPTSGTLYCQTQEEVSQVLAGVAAKFAELTPKSKLLHLQFMDSPSQTQTVSQNEQVNEQDVPTLAVNVKTCALNEPAATVNDPDIGFDASSYFANLSARSLGRRVIYFDVITSTMDVCDTLLRTGVDVYAGLVVVAGRQVTGKGRSDNAWISPAGSLSMSLIFTFPLSSTRLGQHLPFAQHMVALATVLAIRGSRGCAQLDVRVKWPNDIYFGPSVKLGGVLVTSSVCGDVVSCVAGVGVNLSNSVPTICVNDIVRRYNAAAAPAEQQDTPAGPLTSDALAANIVSELERLLTMYNSGRHGEVMRLYYQHWLHSEARVRLECGEPVVVRGVDEDGFLRVQSEGEPRTVHSVQPDGNSFDMLHNLIRIKCPGAAGASTT